MRQGLNTCSRPICDALVILQFNALLLPESYRRLPAGLLVSCYGKAPSMPKTELKHTERGTQHCNNGRPTPVCDLYRPSLKYSVSHSSSMKGPRLNFHAERELAHPKTTFFSSFLQLQYPHVCRRRVVCRYSKKQVTQRQLVLRYRYCTLL